MTVLYTHPFTGSDGSTPTDFTVSQAGGSGATNSIQGNKYRTATSTTAFHSVRGILGSSAWSQADGKATIYFTTFGSVTNILAQIMLRTSGNWDGSQADSPVTGYKFVQNGTNRQLYKRTGGTTTQLGSNVALTLTATTTYGMTLQCQSNQISARMWDASGAEPSTWDIDEPDSAIAGPGQFQMCLVNLAAVARQIDWDDLSLDDLVSVGGTPPVVRPIMRRFGG